MADLTDERVRFWFRHREQIQTWAALSQDAAVAVDGLLDALADDVDELARELGVAMKADLESNESCFMLFRESWGMDQERPGASIAFGWYRDKTLIVQSKLPWVGPRFDLEVAHMRDCRDRFRDLAARVRDERGDQPGNGSGEPWPCYRYLPADGPFWEDFAGYRRTALSAIRSAWEAYSEPMGKVLAEQAEGDA